MKTRWTYIMASICIMFASNAFAAVGWEETFDPLLLTWNEVSADWTDTAGPTAILTENDPVNSYGVVTSETITIDLSVYRELEITATQIDSGAVYSVQIQEVGGSGAYKDAVQYVGTAGTQRIDIASLMGWSGTKSFVINLWVDGESKSVTFGILRMQTPQGPGWTEQFDPIRPTWNQVSALWNDLPGQTAQLTENDPINSYGVATSEMITLNMDFYSELVVTTTAVDSGALYTIQIQEAGGGDNANAVSFMGSPGTQIINVAELMGWSGTKSFVINVWIDGEGKSVSFGLLQIRAPGSGWIENFDPIKASWAQPSATWTDITGPGATLTESDPVNSYGNAVSEIITVDVDQYNELVINATALDAGASYSVQIEEIGGGSLSRDLLSFVGTPGTQVANLASIMGWTGVKSFRINIWIDGDNKGITFDLLQLRLSAPAQDGWVEDFNPMKDTWVDATCSWTDTSGPNAVCTLSPNPNEWWGYTYSEIITLDVSDFNTLYIKTSEVDAHCYYSVQIQEVGGSGVQNAVSYVGTPSEHYINIKDLMGWSGVKTFRIYVWLDCSQNEPHGYNVTFDKLEIRRLSEGTEVQPVLWEDHFDPIQTGWYEMGAYWTDLPDSTATLTEDQAGQNAGKVESPTQLVNLDVYPELKVVVTDVEIGGYLEVGLQEQNGSWAWFLVFPGIVEPGTYKANITDITGWTGYKTFRVVLWMNGNTKSSTVDLVRIGMECGTDILAGDYDENCQVNFEDLVVIGEAWMNGYDMLDLKDVSDNWLEKTY